MLPELENIIKIAKSQQYKTILEQAKAVNSLLEKENKIPVVVLGQFKAGKSSFINTFLNKPVLPVGVTPVTAVITEIVYGTENTVSIIFNNGKKEEVPKEKIKSFVNEKENPENQKGVSLVKVQLPELGTIKNIKLIDTPGTGSIFEHNTEITKNWFKNIGAAIIIISVTQPLSENDIQLLRSAINQTPETFIVLNKADLLEKQELTEIEKFVNDKCKEIFGRSFPVFYFSSKKNTAFYKKSIENEIFKSISNNLKSTKNRIINHKIKYLKELTKSYLEISLKLQNKKQEERDRLKELIIDRKLKLDFVKKELNYISNDYKNSVRIKLEKLIIAKHKDKIINELSEDLKKNYKNWNGNLSKVTNLYETWIKKSISGSMLEIDRKEYAQMQKILDGTAEHFNSYLQNFRERINQNLKNVLGVTMPEEKIRVKVKLMKKANISVSWAFESHIDLLWFLIPMPLLRKYFLKYFLNQIPLEVEKNLRRLVSILTADIQKEIDLLLSQSVHYTISELNKITDILSLNSRENETINESLRILDLN